MKFSFKLYFTMEHQRKINKKDCTISKKQITQYQFLQIFYYGNNYQSYYWLHCTDKIFPQLSLTSNGWNYNEQLNIVVPVWFDEPFPPSIIKKRNKSKKEITVDGYDADLENTEKLLPPAPKKPSKSKQINVISNKKLLMQVNPVKLTITLC